MQLKIYNWAQRLNTLLAGYAMFTYCYKQNDVIWMSRFIILWLGQLHGIPRRIIAIRSTNNTTVRFVFFVANIPIMAFTRHVGYLSTGWTLSINFIPAL
jgi:hypothetical protein